MSKVSNEPLKLDKDTIENICLPWITRPYVDPETGEDLYYEMERYKELSNLCEKLINFDLLELISHGDHSVTVSPIISFLSAAFVSNYSGEKIHHPFRKEYKDITDSTSSILDNFDFGFIWYREGDKWILQVPDRDIDVKKKDVQLILITIIGPDDLTSNILFYDPLKKSWERFAPLGSKEYDTLMDEQIVKHLSNKYSSKKGGISNYYTPISCPIFDGETDPSIKKLYCAVWSIWFLLYKINHPGMEREKQYNHSVAETLIDPNKFNSFVSKYILFINNHKRSMIKDSQKFLKGKSSITHETDNFLSEKVFSLF
jgi:hypothetical protein